MEANQINIFQEGIVSDLDPAKIKNSQWVPPTENVEFFNRDGKGFVVTIMDGVTEEFEITDEFIPVAHKSISGILFIVSLNDTGLGDPVKMEIGCYPSPKSYIVAHYDGETIIPTGEIGFKKMYQPLPNITDDDIRKIFRTDLFDLKFENKISISVDKSFDGSFNIYLSDYTVPNILVNSGFSDTGSLTDVLYDRLQLPDIGNQFLLTKSPPITESVKVYQGGILPSGIYYIYVRYSTSSFDKTPFVKEIGPIQIFDGTNVFSVQGKDGAETTDKLIEIILSNLDGSYEYIDIGVCRFYNLQNTITFDTYLINKFFSNPGEDSTINIRITGTESEALLSEAELLLNNPNFVICKTHAIHENRFFGVGWKSIERDYDDLSALVSNVRIGYDANYHLRDITLNKLYEYETGASDPNENVMDEVDMQYKNYKEIFEKVGYGRGSVVPFGMIIVFSDGTETNPLPCYAVDDYAAASADPHNGNYGFYRFPGYSTIFSDTDREVSHEFAMGVKFDLKAFRDEINANQVKYKDILGFYFVRGQSDDNFIGQGIARRMTRGTKISGSSNVDNGFRAPYFRNKIPILAFWMSCRYKSVNNSEYICLDTFGIFIPDHLFNEIDIENGDSYFVQSIKDVDDIGHVTENTAAHKPGERALELYGDSAPTSYIRETGRLYKVPKGSAVVNGDKYKYRGRYNHEEFYQYDAGTTLNPRNRYVEFARFIAFEPENDIPFGKDEFLVNIYKSNPENVDYYSDLIISQENNLKNIEYFRISEFISIDQLGTLPEISGEVPFVCYKGDIFLQRIIFRQYWWKHRPSNYDEIDDTGIHYEHGLMVSLITENKLNLAMRNDDEDHKYYPKTGEAEIGVSEWVWNGSSTNYDLLLDEAFFYNEGYERILGKKSRFGFDITRPQRQEIYNERIWPTSKKITGSFINSYRTLSPTAYVDYESQFGSINIIDSILGNLITIQDDSINEHYVSEKFLSPGSGQEFILGIGSILSDKYKRIAEYGSQHQAFQRTRNALYGFDAKRMIFWKAYTTRSANTGAAYILADEVSEKTLVSDWIKDGIKQVLNNSINASELPDDPFNGSGLVFGYNPEKRLIYFSVLYYELSASNKTEYNGVTFIYSELFQYFTTKHKIFPSMYMQLDTKFYSTSRKGSVNGNKVFIHNDSDNPGKYYGEDQEAIITFVVNGAGNEGKEFIEKLFTHNQIEMDKIPVESISYETNDQQALLNPFISTSPSSSHEGKFWKDPKYKKGKWNVSAPKASSGTNNYDINSILRGTWLKITIAFKANNRSLSIKNVLTTYKES